jgi:hypothetical protein
MTPIAYGEGMNMAMEQLDMESMDQDTCLVQDRCGSDLMTTGQVFLVPGSSICRGQGKRKTAKEDASLPVDPLNSVLHNYCRSCSPYRHPSTASGSGPPQQ